MSNQPIVLDLEKNILIDPARPPFKNFQVLDQTLVGLRLLADYVRELELTVIERNPYAKGTFRAFSSDFRPTLGSVFNWYSISLMNHLRLIALVDLMQKKNWHENDIANPANRCDISKHCTHYASAAAPEVYRWRNKVAAHFAATDPKKKDDSLATLKLTVMDPITYNYPYFYVGSFQLHSQGTNSELPEWSLTKNFEDLASRFWPGQKLKPLPD